MVLENEFLRAEINSLGAELKSVLHKASKCEILYTGKSEFWNRSAPVLFPIVGRLKDNQYRVAGINYRLSQHGFARDCEFKVELQNENSICLLLKSDEKSLSIFPYPFELRIRYELLSHSITTSYEVKNPSKDTILFSIGAHPGFTCPLTDSDSLIDYYIRFEADDAADKHLLDPATGLFSGKTEEILFPDKKLHLSSELFERDALVFKKLKSSSVYLEDKMGTYSLQFSFPDFPYFAIWSKPGAPFICLEPWFGLADSVQATGKLEDKEGIQQLDAGEKFECSYTFTVRLDGANQ